MIRINKFIADNTSLSRRSADIAIEQGKVTINGQKATLGAVVSDTDQIMLDGIEIKPKQDHKLVVLLNKPVGYVCSKDGQGSPRVYDLLPPKFKNLNIAGRLDKDSSGLVLLTNDGDLLYSLTHPSQNKIKEYEIKLDKALTPEHQSAIQTGIELEDGISKLKLTKIGKEGFTWKVEIQEGRNRQIRRTFASLNYKVVKLHRKKLGPYQLKDLAIREYRVI